MAINFNGTTIDSSDLVYFNGTPLANGKKVYLNGTEVYRRCYVAGDNTTLHSDTLPDVTNESNTLMDSHTLTVCGSVRINYYYTALWKGIRIDIRVNGTTVKQADQVDGSVSQKTVSGSYDTADLSIGDVISIYQEPFHPWDGSGSGNWSIKVD